MSLDVKIANLERFIVQNPALADVPAITVAGKATTPREALNYLRTGANVAEVLQGLQALGLSEPPWDLCEAFYKRIAAASPDIKVYSLASYVPSMSPDEALDHIRAKDAIGEQLVASYAQLLSYMRMRMQ